MQWLAAVCVLTACHDTPVAFGTHADSLFTALAERYTNVERTPRFAAARTKLIHHALSPSRVFDDTTVWNGEDPPAVRVLIVHGAFESGKYRLFDDPTAGVPTHVGETQQVIRLEQTGKGEYEWTTRAVGAVGSITGDDLARVLSTLLSASAIHTDADLRAEYRLAFPKTTAALGQLFSLDTLRTQANGTITLVAVSHPDAMASRYPAFAKYLKKYVEPTRFHSTLRDKSGATWLDVKWNNGALTIACRGTRDGHLAPLFGGTGVMPDTLLLETDIFTKVAIFSAGISALVSERHDDPCATRARMGLRVSSRAEISYSPGHGNIHARLAPTALRGTRLGDPARRARQRGRPVAPLARRTLRRQREHGDEMVRRIREGGRRRLRWTVGGRGEPV